MLLTGSKNKLCICSAVILVIDDAQVLVAVLSKPLATPDNTEVLEINLFLV